MTNRSTDKKIFTQLDMDSYHYKLRYVRVVEATENVSWFFATRQGSVSGLDSKVVIRWATALRQLRVDRHKQITVSNKMKYESPASAPLARLGQESLRSLGRRKARITPILCIKQQGHACMRACSQPSPWWNTAHSS